MLSSRRGLWIGMWPRWMICRALAGARLSGMGLSDIVDVRCLMSVLRSVMVESL